MRAPQIPAQLVRRPAFVLSATGDGRYVAEFTGPYGVSLRVGDELVEAHPPYLPTWKDQP